MSLPKAPVRIVSGDGTLHAADVNDPAGQPWCAAVLPVSPPRAFAVYGNVELPLHSEVCPDCERIYNERYPNPATFNIHSNSADADAIAHALNLQAIIDAAPGEALS